MDDKTKPAYDGAKFDKSGYCLKHPLVRLCMPLSNGSSKQSSTSTAARDTKYVIIRKTCPKCGEHSLRNGRKLKTQTRPHGYEPPSLVKRPSDRGKLLTQSSTRRSLEHVDDIPAPPLCRKALSNIGKPKDSLTSRDTGDCNENSSSSSQSTVTVAHKNSSTKTSSEQKGSKLSPKDSSKSIDLLRAESVDSPPSLYDKRMKAGTRSREKSDTEKSRRSSMTDHKKSSSSKSKSAIVASNNNSSTKSLGPTSSATSRQLSDRTVATDNSACRSLGTKSSISRRHSVTFATSPGTNCEMNIKRHDSAPLPSRFTKMKHESQKAILNLLNEGTPKGSKPELTNDTKHHRRNISKRN